MPGDANYWRLIDFVCPGYSDNDIDIDWRTLGLLGLPRSGKTTLSYTIANDLEKRFNEEFLLIYGFWLHKIKEYAEEERLFDGKRVIMIVLEDATSRYPSSVVRNNMKKDMKAYWEIAHWAKRAGIIQNTGWIIMVINFHTYMVLAKYMRNVHALAIKTIVPQWQRYEHEDVTLKWLDNVIVKELTRMRYSARLEDVKNALNKALVMTIDGWSSIIKYNAIKKKPQNYVEILDDEEEGEENTEENQYMHNIDEEDYRLLLEAVRRILEHENVIYKVDKKKYVNVRINGRWKSLGPIAPLLFPDTHNGNGNAENK